MDAREIERIKQEVRELKERQREMFARLEQMEYLLNEQETAPLKSALSMEPDAGDSVSDKAKSTNLLAYDTDASVSHSIDEVTDTHAAKPYRKAPPGTRNRKEEETPSKNKGSLEFRIGGTWLNRIGVVAVILGLSFFLKYSMDNEWIGPTGRVLLGILAGLGLWFAGEKLKRRYPGYAQGLLGGGSLAIFFSIYSSYTFYQLIPSLWAFVLLSAVMAYTVFMAVRHDSLPIGILGIIGGYTIPFLIESESTSAWVLFSYLILLTLGVLGVSIFRKWNLFQYLSFICNQIFLLLWMVLEYNEQYYAPTLFFAICIFILYLLVSSVYPIRTGIKANAADIGLVVINAFTFFGWSLLVLEDTFVVDYKGVYAAFLALLYLYIGKSAARLFAPDKGHIYGLYAIAFVLITIAVPLQIDGHYIGLAWLAEAVALSGIAIRLNSRKLAYSGLAALLLGLFVTLFYMIEMSGEAKFLLNTASLLLICSLICMVAIIALLRRLVGLAKEILTVLYSFALMLLFYGLTVENHHFFKLQDHSFFLSPEQLSLSVLWLLYAVLLFIAGLIKKNRPLRYSALGLLAVVILKAMFVDLASLQTIYKILLFFLLGLCLLLVSYVYQKKKDITNS